jgi:hypothetical protein
MAKNPKTTSEHLIALYGHLTGVKREINIIKTNHLKHMHEDLTKLDEKLDQKFDTFTNWIIYGISSVAILVLAQLLYLFSK